MPSAQTAGCSVLDASIRACPDAVSGVSAGSFGVSGLPERSTHLSRRSVAGRIEQGHADRQLKAIAVRQVMVCWPKPGSLANTAFQERKTSPRQSSSGERRLAAARPFADLPRGKLRSACLGHQPHWAVVGWSCRNVSHARDTCADKHGCRRRSCSRPVATPSVYLGSSNGIMPTGSLVSVLGRSEEKWRSKTSLKRTARGRTAQVSCWAL
jgi:hypothetical protein